MDLNARVDVNCGRKDGRTDGRKNGCLHRTLLKQKRQKSFRGNITLKECRFKPHCFANSVLGLSFKAFRYTFVIVSNRN